MTIFLKVLKTLGWALASVFAGTAMYHCGEAISDLWTKEA